jgi:hypothetical protein
VENPVIFCCITVKMVYRIVLLLTSNLALCPCCHVPFVLLWPERCTSPVQSHLEVVSIHCCHQVFLRWTVIFIGICHQHLDHFHEEEEKDGNWCRILFHEVPVVSSIHWDLHWKVGHHQNSKCHVLLTKHDLGSHLNPFHSPQ